MYSAKIIADSISLVGKRLTTFELTYPRFVHSELMTHRLFSRNSASSRAIPAPKMRERIMNDPVMPIFWGKNQSGMQAEQELSESEIAEAKKIWLEARDANVAFQERLAKVGVHKQLANRVTEAWMFITVLVTATEWENWFYLRDSEFAQPEIAWVAREMKKVMAESTPREVKYGGWHLPLVYPDDILNPYHPVENVLDWRKVSVGRCARISYLTHDGKRDPLEDVALHDRLAKSGHWSPFEHVATPARDPDKRSGNFFGWDQYRKGFSNEHYGRKLDQDNFDWGPHDAIGGGK